MVLDGVENCLKVIDNFDENKTQNPFSYFTQIVYFAFLRRISKEKKQVYIRSKLLTSNALDLQELQEHDEQGDFTNHYIEYMKAFNNFDGSAFEKPKKEKNLNAAYKGATLDELWEELDELDDTIAPETSGNPS
jgi:DNA-directed RNA polymerase specialized sigma24 family protein